MKNKESNAEIVKREKDKFRVNKIYLIQTKSNKKTTDKLATNILVRCIKKYETYALFDVVDNKGKRLYSTTLDYIDDSYRSREVKRFDVITEKSKW